MFVLKRNGSRQAVDVRKIRDKIIMNVNRAPRLENIDVDLVVDKVKFSLSDGVSTKELNMYTARRCLDLQLVHPDYGDLAARIMVYDHHRNTLTSFKDKIEILRNRLDIHGQNKSLVSKELYEFVRINQKDIESMIDYDRDYLLDAFGICTLQNQYMNKVNGKIVERPQDIFMREAITTGMNTVDYKDPDALKEIKLVYDLLSKKKFTYATPTLINAGMSNQQLSSCFLLRVEDSLDSINKVLDDAAKISKACGGIGIDFSNIRANGSLINSTNGFSSGIVPFARMFGACSDAYNQGGKRKGSFALFLRDYHPDLLEFIQLKNPVGDEKQRAWSLFTCVMLSDLFWKTYEKDGMWHFIDPYVCPELSGMYGEKFEEKIAELVAEGKFMKKMRARDILNQIMKQQFESGVPYVVNFDHVNRKNNLKHYSLVNSSNLCVEICLPSSEHEIAVCNLASIVLPSFVRSKQTKTLEELLEDDDESKELVFDFHGLANVVRVVTRTMDRVIDRNSYPVPETMISNLFHRPIGIGTSGLADVCCLLQIPYDSPDAVKLSAHIAETISYAAYSESTLLAKKYRVEKNVDEQKKISNEIFEIFESSKKYRALDRKISELSRTISNVSRDDLKLLIEERDSHIENPCLEIVPLAKKLGVYPSYYFGEGAPISRGEFQWKLWGLQEKDLSGLWDWETLAEHIKKYGTRNALLTAQMPTATTAQIMSVNESVEAPTSNIFRRGVLSGEYMVFNKYLVRKLIELGLWNERMSQYLIAKNGSIQDIDGIPDDLKHLYRTSWDMGQKINLEHAAARGPFLDHSQSLNVYIGNNVNEASRAGNLYKNLYFAWKIGLKTAIYYLRTQPAMDAQQFTVPIEMSVSMNSEAKNKIKLGSIKRVEADAGERECLMCGT